MAEHELKLKATIDTSQVQQQLSSLGRSAGNGININTQQIDQAFNKLAQSLNKLNATFEKAAMNMAKNANAAGGGAGGMFSGSGRIVGLTSAATFSAFAAKRGMSKVANYYEAIGDHQSARNWKVAGTATSNITRGLSTGAALGATVGSIVPGVGTAVGAGVGAIAGLAVGSVSAAMDYLADKAKEAAESLEKIADWKKSMNDIAETNQHRNEMKTAKGGDTVDRTDVYNINQDRLGRAEKEADRLAGIAKRNGFNIDNLIGKDVDWTKVDKALKGVVDEYQKQQKIIQRSTAILETIDREREKEAKAKEQEAAKAQQLKNWQAGEGGRNAAAIEELKAEQEMATYDSKSDDELNEIVKQAEKDDKELAGKLIDKYNKRQEAVNAGNKNLVEELDGEIVELEKKAKMSGKKGDLASKILGKRQDIADKQGDFEQKYNNRSELDTFEKAISKNNGGIGNLKSLLHDLNQVKMQQNDAMRKANDAGDFDKRDRIAADYDQTSRKIDMVERQIENLKQTNIWEGAGQMSEMAKVGMYVSKSDQGLNDPKLQAQKEGNELLRQIRENTSNQIGGLE